MIHSGYLSRGARPDYAPPGRDSAPVINALIQAAISAGRKEYVLPSGISYYSSPIVIPKGTSNFTLRGQPDGSTVLKALTGFPTDRGMIEIARDDNDSNDVFDLGAGTHTELDVPALRGQTRLVKSDAGGDDLEPGKWYVLSDQGTVPEKQATAWGTIKYRGELVKCISFDTTAGIATLQSAVGRDYSVTPNVLHLEHGTDDRKCANITLKNFQIDGLYEKILPTDPTVYAQVGIWAIFTDHLEIQNVTTGKIDDSHIRCDFCRGIRMEGITMFNVSSQTQDSDKERGVNLFQCIEIDLRNVSAEWLRHGVQFSQGNQDFVLDGYVATNSKDDSPDCHGARNIRGAIRNFETDWSCKIGNASYPAGDQEITVENGNCVEYLRVQGGSQVRAVNVAARQVQLLTMRGQTTFYPHDCEYLSCTLDNPEDSPVNNNFTCSEKDWFSSGDHISRFANQVFKWCTFVQNVPSTTKAAWNVFIEAVSADSDAAFYQCSFTSANDQACIANESQIENTDLTLGFDTCTFDSIANGQFAMFFEATSEGVCSNKDITFYTDFSPNPDYADNESGSEMSVLFSGTNQILPHP